MPNKNNKQNKRDVGTVGKLSTNFEKTNNVSCSVEKKKRECRSLSSSSYTSKNQECRISSVAQGENIANSMKNVGLRKSLRKISGVQGQKHKCDKVSYKSQRSEVGINVDVLTADLLGLDGNLNIHSREKCPRSSYPTSWANKSEQRSVGVKEQKVVSKEHLLRLKEQKTGANKKISREIKKAQQKLQSIIMQHGGKIETMC